MNETFLHYVWFGKLFSLEQQTTDGQKVEIIDIGHLNTDAGPDVFNSKIKIGDTLWAGNVEFHSSANDWQQHHHSADKAYDSVILHVVIKEGKEVFRSNKTVVPQMVIKYPKHIEEQFLTLSLPFVECAKQLIECQVDNLEDIFEKLVTERLESKSASIEKLLAQTSGDWEQAFYVTTARCFGFGTNSDAFERLARNLPQNILAKQKDNLLQIEALLFGVAGFLDNEVEEDYFKALQTEYQYLSHKYALKSIDKTLWKFLRLRPANFPTIRIAQFAALVKKSSKLFSKIIEQKHLKSLLTYFDCEPSEYWQGHYLFGKQSVERTKKLSKSSINVILINSVVPFLYCYGKNFNLPEYQSFALGLLKKIPEETNHITKGFSLLGIVPTSSFDSQALTELKTKYCDRKDCFKCNNKYGFAKFKI
ncbi:MAG: DUF2851 family protein [Prevotellaceae bacterium]|nr:DUF2851 family protein [Prevotellaceae bacterium]